MAISTDVTAELRAMTPEQLDALMADMTDDEVAVVREALAAPELAEAIGQDPEADWRQDPATMGFYLTNHYNIGRKLRLWPYVRLLGEKYRQAFDGESTRQIWNMPPRYGKSLYGSQWGPAWALDRDPTHRIILASYGDSLAMENAVGVRQILRDYAGNLRVQLQQDRQQQSRFVTTAGGGIKAAGIGSAITGFPADGLVVDDPFKNWQEAHSGARRDRVENEFKGTLMSRLEHDDAYVILIHHRVHEDDLTGRLLLQMTQGGADWDLVRIPELAEVYNPADDRPEFRHPDLLGRTPGQPIEPQRFGLQRIKRQHISVGSYLTNLMYQQSPVAEEGGEIKRSWWREEAVFPERYDEAITSWDLKMKNTETGDFVVGQYWGRTGKDFWFQDMLRGQWNQATTENAIALMAVRHPDVRVHHIEAAGLAPEVKASLTQPSHGYQVSDEIAGDLGMTVTERIQVSALRRRGMGGIILKPPKGSKEVRVRAISGRIEAGDVHVPAKASWLGAFLDECVSINAMIFTQQGLVEAGDVQVGDSVLTHRGRFRPVLAVRRRHAPDRLRIKAKALDPLIATPEHPVLSMRLSNASGPGGAYAQGLEWVPAGDLCPRTMRLSARGQLEPSPNSSDALTFPSLDEDHELDEIDLRAWYDYPAAGDTGPGTGKRTTAATDDGTRLTVNVARSAPLRYRQPLDYGFGRICGLWLAEGSYSGGRAQWSFNAAETDYIDEVRRFLADRFETPSATFTPQRSPHCTIVSASLRRLAPWFATFGHRATGKRIPAWAWAAPADFHRGIIDGWLDGDGHDGRGSTVSPHLAWGIRLLSTRFGSWPKITVTAPRLAKEPGADGGRRINGRHSTYTVDTRAKSRVSEVWIDADGDETLGFWVRSTEHIGPGDVVNFHVEEDESYVTTGGTVHNCASFPTGTHDDMVDAMSQAIQRLMKGRASVAVASGTIGPTQINTRGAGTMTVTPTGRPPVAGQRQPVRRSSAGVMMPKIDPRGGR